MATVGAASAAAGAGIGTFITSFDPADGPPTVNETEVPTQTDRPSPTPTPDPGGVAPSPTDPGTQTQTPSATPSPPTPTDRPTATRSRADSSDSESSKDLVFESDRTILDVCDVAPGDAGSGNTTVESRANEDGEAGITGIGIADQENGVTDAEAPSTARRAQASSPNTSRCK
jgi:hypothetical protein